MKPSTIFHLALVLMGPTVSEQFSYPDDYYPCITLSARPGTCINVQNCPALFRLFEGDTLSLQDRRILDKSRCGFEGIMPKVCCEQDNVGQVTSTTSSQPYSSTELSLPSRFAEPQPPDVTNHPNLPFLDFNKCGLNGQDRIIGGNVTGIQEFPWMALLVYHTGKGRAEFQCGGSIINERYILTAAHCVVDLTPPSKLIAVRVGEHNLQTEIDCVDTGTEFELCNDRYQDLGIDEIIPHPEYSSKTKTIHNDIALIRLYRKINLKPANVKAICLPISDDVSLSSKDLTVTGWGIMNWKKEASMILLKAKLPRIPQEKCARIYEQSVEIWYKQLCVGGEGNKDSCQGDSGGPLQTTKLYHGRPRYIQYGIVSFGSAKCGAESKPSVYTRVDFYLDWILDNMRS